jgi:hypothetical protein
VAQVVGVPGVVVHEGLEPDGRVLRRHGVVPDWQRRAGGGGGGEGEGEGEQGRAAGDVGSGAGCRNALSAVLQQCRRRHHRHRQPSPTSHRPQQPASQPASQPGQGGRAARSPAFL